MKANEIWLISIREQLCMLTAKFGDHISVLTLYNVVPPAAEHHIKSRRAREIAELSAGYILIVLLPRLES